MYNMKTATVREVRHDFGRVLNWVDEGEEVRITKRHRIVAKLVPPDPEHPRKVRMPDFQKRLARLFGSNRIRAIEELLREREERI